MVRRIASSAPASITGLGCLYGVGGIAVEYARDYVVIEAKRRGGINVEVVEGEAPGSRYNVAYHVARAFLEKTGLSIGLDIKVYKRVPQGLGLGSSASTAAATAYALNKMIGSELRVSELVEVAAQGEIAAVGHPRYDSVAPSLLGGITIIMSWDPLRIASLAPPDNLWLLVFIAQRPGHSGARAPVPRKMGLENVVEQVAAASELLIGVFEKNPTLIGDAVNRGGPIEKARATTIPGYFEAKEAALEAGAFGFNIAGRGPTTFALVSSDSVIRVMESVTQAFANHGIEVEARVVRPDLEGARLEDPDLLML